MGLVWRLNKDGVRVFSIRYWQDGREYQEVVGPNRRAAELALAKRRTEIREGKFFPTAPGLKLPYTELLDRYLAYGKTAKKPRTSQLDHQVINGHIRPALGTLPLKALTPAKVLAYVQQKLESGLSPSTVSYHFTLLKHSFTMAKTWELLRDNPMRDVRFPVKVANQRVRYLTIEELKRLLDACTPEWRRIVLLGVHTGMRKAEIITLTWEQIDFDHAFLILIVGTTKNRRQHVVSLNDVALAALREQQAAQQRLDFVTPWVFVNPKTRTHYWPSSDTAWYTALRKAGITNFRFHDLRHTMASHLRMQGADLLTIKELLGHQDFKSTERYAHISPLHRLSVVKRLEGALAHDVSDRDKFVDMKTDAVLRNR